MRTNKRRVSVMGAHPKQCWPPCSYLYLDQVGSGPGPVFFNDFAFGIRELAFETPQPVHITQSPSLPKPESPYPESTSLEEYFYTSAILDNVTELTPCRFETGSGSFISGLLLRYSNGCRACVGQIRLDRLQHSLAVGTSQKMCLGFSQISDGCPRLVSVGFSGLSRIDLNNLEIPLCGKLEWWFSHRQCKVYHDGRASLKTRY